MTHDALCYRSHDQTLGNDSFCQCAALAKAREDERSNNFTPDDHANGMTEAYQRGLAAAWEAVKHLQHSDDCYYAEGVLCHCEIKRAITAIDALRKEPQ